jgi:hypothetical protein
LALVIVAFGMLGSFGQEQDLQGRFSSCRWVYFGFFFGGLPDMSFPRIVALTPLLNL